MIIERGGIKYEVVQEHNRFSNAITALEQGCLILVKNELDGEVDVIKLVDGWFVYVDTTGLRFNLNSLASFFNDGSTVNVYEVKELPKAYTYTYRVDHRFTSEKEITSCGNCPQGNVWGSLDGFRVACDILTDKKQYLTSGEAEVYKFPNCPLQLIKE